MDKDKISLPSSSNAEASGSSSTKPSLTSYLKEINLLTEGEGFAVIPIKDCPHVEVIQPVPNSGVNINSPCLDCSSVAENWICLSCYSSYCGREINKHMLNHFSKTSHPITLSFTDLSVWCYHCDSYIEHPALFEVKNAANLSKFGEKLPNIYG
uniref:UBP-type domain-containing protein n=1 Tax=Clastoptera arizonana TaxID=38151 RepID=A0A1B6CBL3_9HEMI